MQSSLRYAIPLCEHDGGSGILPYHRSQVFIKNGEACSPTVMSWQRSTGLDNLASVRDDAPGQRDGQQHVVRRVIHANDEDYLGILTACIRVCAEYQPKLGHAAKVGYGLEEFQRIYKADPFYNWLGLDNPLMYAAHKAAGGMTSIYRQIGIGCEVLFRRVLQDQLGLNDEDVRWSYSLPRSGGRARTLHLDARIPLSSVSDTSRRGRVRSWMRAAARRIDVDAEVAKTLRGIVFEIRQGYKSKDSKRQNADIANAATAYTRGLLPCAGILSLQIDDDISQRYRHERWVVLTGLTGAVSSHESIYAFCRDVVGYDLAGFFERNCRSLKKEVETVLTVLPTPS